MTTPSSCTLRPFFEQARRRAMGLEMGCVDHQLIGLAASRRERGEDLVEYAEAAPVNETVVDRLVWPVLLGASHHRSAWRITKMMPLTMRRPTRQAQDRGAHLGTSRCLVALGPGENSLDHRRRGGLSW